MDYQAAYTKLLGLVDLERIRSATRFRKRYNLAKMEAILDRMGDPPDPNARAPHHRNQREGQHRPLCAPRSWSAPDTTQDSTRRPHIHTFRERIQTGRGTSQPR